jgi:nucleoside-diphosphate-sugar epimerase
VPFWVAKAGALVEEARAAVAGREPAISREVVEIYKHHWVYSSLKAARELGYEITPFETGLTRTVAWVKQQIEAGNIK